MLVMAAGCHRAVNSRNAHGPLDERGGLIQETFYPALPCWDPGPGMDWE